MMFEKEKNEKAIDLLLTIRPIVEEFGFQIKEHGFTSFWGWDITDPSDEISFVLPLHWSYDEESKTSTLPFTVRASVRKCGGEPSADDLLFTARKITSAAMLVKVLNAMNLVVTVKH